MFAQIAEKSGRDPDELSAEAVSKAALRRHVAPEDVAAAVLFVASPRSGNVTGDEITVIAVAGVATGLYALLRPTPVGLAA